MKISELIKKLNEIKDESGDIEVGYWADPYGGSNEWFYTIDEVGITGNAHPSIDAKKTDYTRQDTVVSLR